VGKVKGMSKKAQPQKKAAAGKAFKKLPVKKKAHPKKMPMGTLTAGKASKKAVPAKKTAPPTKAPKNAEAAAKMKADMLAAFAELDRVGLLRKEMQALTVPQLCAYWQQYYGFQPAAKSLASERGINYLIQEHVEELIEAGTDEDLTEEDDALNLDIEEALERVESIKGGEASKPTTQPDAEKPASYPNLRRRVGELLDKLNDSALQWLHFEITEGEITTDKEQGEARETFPPLDRPALIQDLTTIAVDVFQLADDPDLAETLRDENSIRFFLAARKKGKPSKGQKTLFPE
jgi:hypothetical protein